MVGSVQGNSTSDINAINQQTQDFKDGKTKITKEALTNTLTSTIKQGQEPLVAVIGLMDSYDQIDKNNDGISYDEFETYKSSPKGMLGSLGLSAESIKQQMNTLSLGLLGADSTGVLSQPSLLDFGLFDDNNTSSDSSENSLLGSFDNSSFYNSSISQLMKTYSTTNTNNDAISSLVSELG
jgi:hypothetical protein